MSAPYEDMATMGEGVWPKAPIAVSYAEIIDTLREVRGDFEVTLEEQLEGGGVRRVYVSVVTRRPMWAWWRAWRRRAP